MSSPEQVAEIAATEKAHRREMPWFLESNIIRWTLAGLILVLLWVMNAFFSRSTIIEVIEAFIILSTEGDSGGFVLADHAAYAHADPLFQPGVERD